FAAGDPNLARYVFNSPANYTDPTGLAAAPAPASGWSRFLDGLQLVLDVIGLFPVYGELADGINALISLFRAKWLDAGLSALALIPGFGILATLGKWGKKGAKVADNFVTTGAKIADEAAELRKVENVVTPAAKVSDNLGRAFEAAVKRTFRKKIIRENEEIYDAAGEKIAEIDFETSEALVEVGISLGDKLEQLHKLAEIAKQRR
ncbi:MAG: hypothetical protein K6T61_17755, partial [Bryobacteraceae bacterium]|nr:hypothetical protein [Bryobacteraceae bacterium]